jgi:outer membrane lipoprotein carrier protein
MPRRCLCTLAMLLLAATANAADDPLARYLAGLVTLQADFAQTTTDARGKQVESGKGRLLVQRPGRFRWEYRAQAAGDDGGQVLVADGRNLWFYERDLAQVTVRDVAEALEATPVVLLSGTAAEVDAAFAIAAAPRRDGLDWVSVTPRAQGGDFSRAELGFRNGALMSMQISDKLGQTVLLRFTHSARNTPIAPAELQFTPPGGVDVIGTALH